MEATKEEVLKGLSDGFVVMAEEHIKKESEAKLNAVKEFAAEYDWDAVFGSSINGEKVNYSARCRTLEGLLDLHFGIKSGVARESAEATAAAIDRYYNSKN